MLYLLLFTHADGSRGSKAFSHICVCVWFCLSFCLFVRTIKPTPTNQTLLNLQLPHH